MNLVDEEMRRNERAESCDEIGLISSLFYIKQGVEFIKVNTFSYYCTINFE